MSRRRAIRDVPHLGIGPSRRYHAHGFPQIDRATACGRRVATTLTTNAVDAVRCVDCIEAGAER